MRAGLNAGIGSRRNLGGGVVAPFQSIRTDGWSGDATAPAAAVGQTVSVLRNGYDASGNTTTFSDTLTITTRVRTVWNVGWTSAGTVPVNDATRIALSDYVYQGETIAGVSNGSTVVSPQPIAAWVSIERQLIGNTVTLEVVAGHRDARGGKPVACVTGTLTDGTNTVTAISATPVISSYPGDANPLPVYALTFDTTTLASNTLLTANAKVYPHVGVAASVLDSSLSSDRRGFSPRYYVKDVGRLAAPPIAYVDVGATGGTWSTTAATAEADPFPTIEAARLAIVSQSGVTGGYSDGCVIRLMAGSHSSATGGTATSIPNRAASITITRDPNATRATAIITFSSAFRFRFAAPSYAGVQGGAVYVTDVTITRTASTWQGESAAGGMQVRIDQCNIDNSSNTGWLSNSHDYIYGCTITTTIAASTWLSQNGATNDHRMWRGCVCTNLRQSNLAAYYVLSSNLTNVGTLIAPVAQSQSGVLRAYNKYLGITTSSGGFEAFGVAATENATGLYRANNVYEPLTAAASYTGCSSSADEPQAGILTHDVMHNNTVLGAAAAFRANLDYDITYTVFRTPTLQSFKGNIYPQLNTKGDWFYGTNAIGGITNQGGEAPNHIGNWGTLYGVGCAGNYIMYIDAGGSGFGGNVSQAYGGIGSIMGSSATAKIDPLLTTYAAVDYVAGVLTAGAGGTVATLQAGSPCKLRLPYSVTPFDLAGTARAASGADSTGAYV